MASLLSFPAQVAYGAEEQADTQRRAIEEITVTARRREESSQDVPIPVIAFSGDKLERQFAATLEDLNHSIPNAQLEHVGLFQSAAAYSFRGIGIAGIESFADPVVSVFVNGAYFSRNAESLLGMTDVQSVQILRGPQGTLYGRNAFAGAIVVETKKADFNEWNSSFKVHVGDAGRRDYHAAVNIPLIDDTLALRLAGLSQNLDGYFEDEVIGEDLNGEEANVFRASLKWQATDALQFDFIGQLRRDRGDSTTGVHMFYWPGSAIIGDQLVGGGPSLFSILLGRPGKNSFGDSRIHDSGDGSDPFKTARNLEPNKTHYDIDEFTINANYETSYGTWSFMTNVRTVDDTTFTDTDGTELDLFSSARFQDFKSRQMELYFVSDYTDRG